MKKTIKIIDLLVKVANGEEVPENIEYDNKVMKYDHNKQDYKGYYSNGNGTWLFQYLFDKCRNTSHFINDYVEILDEEEFKDIEEITIRDKTVGFPNGEWTARNMDKAFSIKINQLIKNQKKIMERLNDVKKEKKNIQR